MIALGMSWLLLLTEDGIMECNGLSWAVAAEGRAELGWEPGAED